MRGHLRYRTFDQPIAELTSARFQSAVPSTIQFAETLFEESNLTEEERLL
jgi:hypothetical protein